MPFRSAALSDRGRVRPQNEDSHLADREHDLFAVADGMGGHAAGEVASRLAVEALHRRVAEGSPEVSRADLLRTALEEANRAILERAAREPELAGMGTTLTVLLGGGHAATIAHIGDSRLYRLRGGRLECLTTDHTVVQRYMEAGQISSAEARLHPMRHVLTRALGIDGELEVDIQETEVREKDLFLLCSDGLTGMVDDGDLQAMLCQPLELEDAARQLVGAANLRGGEDNITVVLVRRE